MARRSKASAPDGEIAVAAPARTTPAPLPASRLPAAIRFPLVAILSLALSAVLLSFSSDFTGFEVASISRSLNEWSQVATFIAWKVGELAVGWFLGYDDYDVASLTVLTHAPYFYLIHAFYGISWQTAGTLLVFDLVSASVPFALLRPRAAYHASYAPKSAVPNRTIIHDIPTKVVVTAGAATVSALVIYASFLTWLPVFLITHFDGIRSLEAAYTTGHFMLIAYCWAIGTSAYTFLFSSSLAAQPNLGDAKARAFNPETATLSETVQHNFYGSKKRTRVLLQRTAAMAILTALNTSVQTYVVLEGAELLGATGWAGLWVVAEVAAAGFLGWCGDV